ncbi:uncharacterized protein An12g08500 [Aspergillus niger]|uniref:Contig An12c0280, genomic contig n=2 Tax=Aspergillus niger TaxID=5061 RepID=A2R0G2_ASPNC|nr:uncharacterized protein An12g08500 [Aspergillus niger]CAK41300.1 unnamed protein product [Aspergillus niger]
MASFWVAESAGPSGRRKGKRLDQARQKRHETQGTSPTAGGSGKAGRFAMGPSKECNRLLFGSTGSLDTMRLRATLNNQDKMCGPYLEEMIVV